MDHSPSTPRNTRSSSPQRSAPGSPAARAPTTHAQARPPASTSMPASPPRTRRPRPIRGVSARREGGERAVGRSNDTHLDLQRRALLIRPRPDRVCHALRIRRRHVRPRRRVPACPSPSSARRHAGPIQPARRTLWRAQIRLAPDEQHRDRRPANRAHLFYPLPVPRQQMWLHERGGTYLDRHVLERVRRVDGEGDEDNVRFRVRHRPQALSAAVRTHHA